MTTHETTTVGDFENRRRPRATGRPAGTDTAMAASVPLALVSQDPAPLSWDAAKVNVRETLVDVWQQFLGHVPYLVAGLLALVATALGALLLRHLMGRLLRRSHMRASLRELIARLVFLGVWFGGLLVVAMVVFPGLTPTKALGGLGIASVAVGFAFKDIFENFFAGVLILWRFPFESGDYIATGSIMGRVEEITIRNTLIRQPTEELVVVPNSRLFSQPVEVLTNGELRRVTMECGVAYESDVDAAVEAIRSAIEGCETVSTSREPQVFPRDFGDSSVNIEIAWFTSPEPIDLRRSRAEVVTAVKRSLEDAGIEIPFPQRVLTFKSAAAERAVLNEAV